MGNQLPLPADDEPSVPPARRGSRSETPTPFPGMTYNDNWDQADNQHFGLVDLAVIDDWVTHITNAIVDMSRVIEYYIVTNSGTWDNVAARMCGMFGIRTGEQAERFFGRMMKSIAVVDAMRTVDAAEKDGGIVAAIMDPDDA